VLSYLIAKNDKRFPKRLLAIKPQVKNLWVKGEWNESYFEKTVAILVCSVLIK